MNIEDKDRFDYGNTFEKGSAAWKISNGQKYLEIDAPDHYSLGYLEGKFLSSRIISFKRIIQSYSMLFAFRGITYKKMCNYAMKSLPIMEEWAEKYEGFEGLIDEMNGIADAIPVIDFKDVLLQNYFIEVMYGWLIPMMRVSIPPDFTLGCTALGFIDENGRPIVGQNFDFSPLTKMCSSFVLHKLPDKPSIFSFRIGGMLSLPAAVTSNGVTMNVTVVKTVFPSQHIVGTGIRARYGLEHAKNAEFLFNMLKNTKDAIGYNLIISDNSNLFGLEITPFGILRRDAGDFIVKSNTFVSPELQKYLLNKRYSKKRQQLAESLMHKIKVGNSVKKEGDEGIKDKKSYRLMKVLSHRPMICRTKTISFISNDFFGLGKPCKGKWGIVPIK